MKLIDREVVDGTQVAIGRKVQYRKSEHGPVQKVSKTYTAEYTEDGKRRFEGLGTTNRREARRRAIEIQAQLDDGTQREKPTRLGVQALIDRYEAYNEARDLAPKTRAKYFSDLFKLRQFCEEANIRRASQFDEEAFARYGAWLRSKTHKQGTEYANKSVYTALTIAKQMFKWGWRQRLIPVTSLVGTRLPSARARPQQSFTSEQIDALLERSEGVMHHAIAILAFTGLRVGELEALLWSDVKLEMSELGMLHIRRGGSSGSTKSGRDRFVPIHPRIRPIIDELPRSDERVLPGLRARTLLSQVKRLCRELGYSPELKVHSFRHTFASSCANSRVPLRLAMAWLGHNSSSILNLYYHLHDTESEAAMKVLAENNTKSRE